MNTELTTEIVSKYISIIRALKEYECQRVFTNKYYSLKRQANKIEKQFPIFTK